LDALEQKHSPFETGPPPREANTHWVEPQLVAEIAFAEWTQNDMLRQPRFEGLRMDKKPKQVKREKPKAVSAAKATSRRRTTLRKNIPLAKAPTSPTSNVNFTNVDRVVFPEAGYTKGDVIAFYLRVAPKLLPHL